MIIFWILTNRLGATYEEKLILKIVCTRFFFDTHGLDFKKHSGESCRNSNQLIIYLNLGIIQFEAQVLKALKSKNIMSISKETHEAQCTGMGETSVHLLLGTLSRIKSLQQSFTEYQSPYFARPPIIIIYNISGELIILVSIWPTT